MPSTFRKLTAWIVLAVYLLSGVAPAQRFVLCVEADGCVSLEAMQEADPCAPCTPCTIDAGCGGEEAGAADEHSDAGACACIDIPLPSQVDAPQLGARTKPSSSTLAAVLPSAPVASVTSPVAACLRSLPLAQRPRPAPGLASIRTTILRI
jgi:hypothetical protein